MRTGLLLVLVVLLGCGGGGSHSFQIVPPVHAQTTSDWIGQSDPGVGPACFQGCVIAESPGKFIAIRGVQGTNLPQVNPPNGYPGMTFNATISAAMQLQLIDTWIGTATDTKLEVGSLIRLELPDGTFYDFSHELDKHQDHIGSLQRSFPVSISLPAGTRVRMKTFIIPISCSMPAEQCGNAQVDFTWRLYGK